MGKSVGDHIDIFGKHDCHSGTVLFEGVVFIQVMVGKHEMESIADVVVAVIVSNDAAIRKFKIDAISCSLNFVVFN